MSEESDALSTMDTIMNAVCTGPSFDLDVRRSTTACAYWFCRACGAEIRHYAGMTYPSMTHYRPGSQVAMTPLTETNVRRIVAEEMAKVRASLVHDVLYELSQRMKAQRTSKQ
jgi:hypothetical protein